MLKCTICPPHALLMPTASDVRWMNSTTAHRCAMLRSAKLPSSPNELSMTHVQHQIQLLKLFLAPVVKKVDNAIYWISLYSLKSAIGLPNSYPLNNDLSGE